MVLRGFFVETSRFGCFEREKASYKKGRRLRVWEPPFFCVLTFRVTILRVIPGTFGLGIYRGEAKDAKRAGVVGGYVPGIPCAIPESRWQMAPRKSLGCKCGAGMRGEDGPCFVINDDCDRLGVLAQGFAVGSDVRGRR